MNFISLFKRLNRSPKAMLLLLCLATALLLTQLVVNGNQNDPIDTTLPASPSGYVWKQVFRDDFNGDVLNRSNWVDCYDWREPDQSGCTNQGNSEQEWYVPEAVSVSGGNAMLKANKRNVNGRIDGALKVFDYTSGMISTGRQTANDNPKWTGTYGYYQARLKIPSGQGLWPAFWLLPADQSWPPEIDIMESLGHRPNEILQTYFWNDGKFPPPKDTGVFAGVDFSQDWHTFAINWQPGSIDWYVDGVLGKQAKSQSVPNRPMEILLNLAVGGQLPGLPNDSTNFPTDMKIDFVKVHQLIPAR